MNLAANPSPGLKEHPSHVITTRPFNGTVVVTFSDAVIASTDNAIELREADYPPVFYVPFEDVYFEFLTASDTRTRCPFKGTASYWNVTAVGEAMKDVMWAYKDPYDEVRGIKDHGAFYADKVRIEATPRDGKPKDL